MSQLSKSADIVFDATVFLIDDDELLCETVGLILESVGIRYQTFSCVDAFFRVYSKEACQSLAGCIVCDIRMPNISGLECQRILNSHHSILPVIFMTGYADVKIAVEAMQEDAFDFIEKPFREQAFIESVQRALSKNAEKLRKWETEKSILQSLATLSPREQAVMELMIDGLPNKAISTGLDISLRTVEVHRAHVLEKMAAKNVAELVKQVLTVRQ